MLSRLIKHLNKTVSVTEKHTCITLWWKQCLCSWCPKFWKWVDKDVIRVITVVSAKSAVAHFWHTLVHHLKAHMRLCGHKLTGDYFIDAFASRALGLRRLHTVAWLHPHWNLRAAQVTRQNSIRLRKHRTRHSFIHMRGSSLSWHRILTPVMQLTAATSRCSPTGFQDMQQYRKKCSCLRSQKTVRIFFFNNHILFFSTHWLCLFAVTIFLCLKLCQTSYATHTQYSVWYIFIDTLHICTEIQSLTNNSVCRLKCVPCSRIRKGISCSSTRSKCRAGSTSHEEQWLDTTSCMACVSRFIHQPH